MLNGGPIEDGIGRRVRAQQGRHFRSQLSVIAAGILKEGALGGALERARLLEDLLHALPTLGRHLQITFIAPQVSLKLSAPQLERHPRCLNLPR